MSPFKSAREKQLWVWAFFVLLAIFFTLFINRPIIDLFSNQNVQAIIFVLVMILVGATIIVHALRRKPGKIELTLLLGMVAVYTMLFLRLGLPERSHLMEYSVLAIFIHRALAERYREEHKILKPALYALVISILIGFLDECIQFFLPERVFDTNDIIFNSFAVTMALGSALLLAWIRKRKKIPEIEK